MAEDLENLLFVESTEVCKTKLLALEKACVSKSKAETLLDYLSRDNSEISKLQDQVKRMHLRDFDDALRADTLIQDYLKESE